MIEPRPREEPAFDLAGERPMLEGWLDYHRATLILKCSGLSAQDLLRREVPPSTMSLLGLLRHLTEVERSWFGRTVAGEERPPLYYSDTDPDGDFEGGEDQDPAQAMEAWMEACDESRMFAGRIASLDSPAPGWKHPNETAPSLRWIMVHMIEEYARHNGHADLLRERIDGATGD